jgi:hypothetical protein
MFGWLSEIVTDYSRPFVLNATKAGPDKPISSLERQLKFESLLLMMFVSNSRRAPSAKMRLDCISALLILSLTPRQDLDDVLTMTCGEAQEFRVH